MSYSKWLGAGIGWSFGGPIGAILGLALGSIVDAISDSNKQPLIGDRNYDYGRERGQPYAKPKTESGDFEVSLLILATVVIKADGKQDKRELDYVRNYFANVYGKERANHAFRLFKQVSNQNNISTRQVCLQIRNMMVHASRLQLLHFLFGIAQADGMVTEDEVKQIYTMSGYLGISSRDFESIKAMFYDSADNAYKILEISKSATDDEVKKAYRKMAKKYHPDRIMHLGPEHQKGAEEKFRQVQMAYEKLQKERGF